MENLISAAISADLYTKVVRKVLQLAFSSVTTASKTRPLKVKKR